MAAFHYFSEYDKNSVSDVATILPSSINEVIRGRVEEILNEFLEVKAEKLTQAALEDTSIAG